MNRAGTSSEQISQCMPETLEPLRPSQLLCASGPNGRAEFANREFGCELRVTTGRSDFLRYNISAKGAAGAG